MCVQTPFNACINAGQVTSILEINAVAHSSVSSTPVELFVFLLH